MEKYVYFDISSQNLTPYTETGYVFDFYDANTNHKIYSLNTFSYDDVWYSYDNEEWLNFPKEGLKTEHSFRAKVKISKNSFQNMFLHNEDTILQKYIYEHKYLFNKKIDLFDDVCVARNGANFAIDGHIFSCLGNAVELTIPYKNIDFRRILSDYNRGLIFVADAMGVSILTTSGYLVTDIYLWGSFPFNWEDFQWRINELDGSIFVFIKTGSTRRIFYIKNNALINSSIIANDILNIYAGTNGGKVGYFCEMNNRIYFYNGSTFSIYRYIMGDERVLWVDSLGYVYCIVDDFLVVYDGLTILSETNINDLSGLSTFSVIGATYKNPFLVISYERQILSLEIKNGQVINYSKHTTDWANYNVGLSLIGEDIFVRCVAKKLHVNEVSFIPDDNSSSSSSSDSSLSETSSSSSSSESSSSNSLSETSSSSSSSESSSSEDEIPIDTKHSFTTTGVLSKKERGDSVADGGNDEVIAGFSTAGTLLIKDRGDEDVDSISNTATSNISTGGTLSIKDRGDIEVAEEVNSVSTSIATGGVLLFKDAGDIIIGAT